MFEMVEKIEEADFITHSGTMHADDVFSTAFLILYKKKGKIIRVNDVDLTKTKESAIVYDIGKGTFDHHQMDAKVRENGIKYASFGLLWEAFGKDFLRKEKIDNIEEVYTYFENDFVMAIDAIDNGMFPKIDACYKVKTISDAIKLFNPGYQSMEDSNTNFLKAVSFAKTLFERELVSVVGKVKAREKVLAILKKTEGPLLILDEFMPYEEVILSSVEGKNILFVLFPSNREGYTVKTVPISKENFESRYPFPEEWAGKTNEEFEEVSKVKGALFCHKNRFLITAKTKEAAIQLVDKTLKEKK